MTEEQKKEITRFWGKPSYLSGLDLFGKSHESVANNAKATTDNISSTNLEEILSEVDNNK